MVPDNATNPTDEDVLADPSSFTVDQVTDAFSRVPDDQVVATQVLETDGKTRSRITDWERPQAPTDSSEARYTRERLLSAEGGEVVGVPGYVIAGALHDVEGDDFTASELQQHANAFLSRPVPTEEG